ncbi:MAG: polyribonucleotide nucleotidyltransferase [Patescibacteria group bacterium]|nr:polyribonucleotide nucleotidyltransferase [Patescibacteria group bacterium]
MQTRSFSTEIGGKTLTAEFNDLAENADGSVILRYGNTAVIATAVISERTREDIDYFPLTVDYEERFYAAGQILGSRFVRREGRPSDQAILSGRVVDRTIRPLFNWNIRNEVQVVITVLSIDEDDPDMLAVNAASLALAVSRIPWGGPVAAVRIGKIKGGSDLIINPSYAFREKTDTAFDLLACGQRGTINMIEVGSREVSEEDITQALERAVEEQEKLLVWQRQIIKEIGKEKAILKTGEVPDALQTLFNNEFKKELHDVIFCGTPGKESISDLKKRFVARYTQVEELKDVKKSTAERFLEDRVNDEIHRGAIEDGKRADGRAFDELRPIFAKAGGVSPMLHGSGIFYRGGTHVFTALTLGGPGDSLVIDTMEEQEVKKRFMHHYNFPPFSVGETGRMGGLNRRMVGHGYLAEKSLEAVIPPKEQFPYTIRLVSECMASNGSTSMGSVCASTIALMDGGIPIKAPVAGIAMGLMMSPRFTEDKKYRVLTDIQGPEDHHGDMDFKVAGTRAGITGIQLDIKLDGVPVSILTEALHAAREARFKILDVIEKEISTPRKSLSPRAPEIATMSVRPDQIGLVIGGGGKTINGIKETSGAEDITVEDDGSIFITGRNGTAQKARELIEAVVKEYKAGEVYEGTVTRLMDFGAFVRIGPMKDAEGLVHVSEVAPFRIDKISDALAIGDKVRVMIKEIDEKGRINLSIKQIDPDFASRKGLKPSTNPSHGGRNHTGNERRFQ